jgi:hypothetical protein
MDLARDLGEAPLMETVAPEPTPLRFHTLELGSEGPVTVYKCFVPEEHEDGEDGEFYLRLNRETGEGELSLSDPAYAPKLVDLFRRAMAEGARATRASSEGTTNPRQRAQALGAHDRSSHHP